MDFFKGVGDFFRGAFGGNDDEKKRKQREEAQRKQQVKQPKAPKLQQPQMAMQQKQKKQSPVDASPLTLQQNQPKKAPTVAPVAPAITDAEKKEKQRQISSIISGVKYKPSKNYLSKDEYEATVKKRDQMNRKANPTALEVVAGGLSDAFIKEPGERLQRSIDQVRVQNVARKKGVTNIDLKKGGYQSDEKVKKQFAKEIAKAEKETGVKFGGQKEREEASETLLGLGLGGSQEIRDILKRATKEVAPAVGEVAKDSTDAAVEAFQDILRKSKDSRAIRAEEKKMAKEGEAPELPNRRQETPAEPDTKPAFERKREQQAAVEEAPSVEDIPAYQRQGKELQSDRERSQRIEELQKQVDNMPDDETIRAYEFNLRQKFAEDVRKNPDLEKQLRQRLEDNLQKLKQDVGYAASRKAELDTLKDEANTARQATKNAVALEEERVAQAQDLRAAVQKEVDELSQAKAAAPNPGDPTPPAGGAPEVEANNGYGNTFDMTDEILRQAGVDTEKGKTTESGIKKFFHKATGGFISDPYKQMVDKIRDATGDMAYQAAQGNVFQSGIGRVATLFGNNAVLKDSIRQIMRVRNDAQSAAGDAVKRLHDTISDKVAKLDMPPEQFNQLLDRVFETPEFLARKYGDDVKVDIESLPPQVREIVDQLISVNKLRNRALFDQGKISLEEFKLFENGMHSPRLYDFEKTSVGTKGNKIIDTTATKKRKDLEEISDETFEQLIESPAQRMLIRLEMAMRSNASNDALKAYKEAGMLLDNAPNNQFSRLEGAKWGDFEGKFVYNPIKGQLEDGIVMNTDTGKKFNDILDDYRNSVFGKADRFMKKTKTVYSPGTFIGNVLSNPILFNKGAGVNRLGQSARMAKAGADLVGHRTGRKFDADIYEAQKYGVFSSDTGRQITGRDNPELSVARTSKTNPFEAAYGGADDAAKLAIWRGLRARGVEPEEAARRVSQFTQDYNNAGRLVQTLADLPVMGKPFARFAPELSRLVKNNVMYNPVGMVAGVAGIAYIQNELSQAAGETPEEREARETGMGQTLIPGTAWINKALTGTDRDVSLNFPVGDSAYNVARAVGLNFPVDETGSPNMALLKSLVPWAIPTRENAQGETVIAPEEMFTSLAWSPIAQQIANRDFMGRTVDDPNNKIYYENGDATVRKFSGDNPDSVLDRVQHLLMGYVPLANETQSVASGVMGKEDYYGKQRSIPDAIARVFGVKAESNDEEAREKRIDTKQYFEEDLEAVNSFIRENPDLADSYFKYRNPTRDRENVKVSDLVSPERWDIINTETSGRLFNFLKEQAIKQNQNDGKPLDPIFTLPADQAKYVTELRSRPTGDDEEAKDILRATSDWYKNFENNYFKYLDENSKYYDALPKSEGAAKDNPRVAAYGEASVPVEQPDIIAEYYRIKAQDPEQAKAVYKANKDALSAAFDTYAAQKLERINKLRKIEGYEPISLETYKNDTFGFDAGSSSGYGSGGGRGGSKDVNTLGNLTNFSKTIDPLSVEAPVEEMPNSVALFQKLMATRSGGRSKPQLGASSKGQ